jgi:hypothetical protein
MDNPEREILLGYLMNALENDEIASIERELLRQPELRTELATLQKELSPLTSLDESVEPPCRLAKRTCDRIWAQLDQKNCPNRFPNSASVTNPVLAMSFETASENCQNAMENTVSNPAVLEKVPVFSPQASSHAPQELLSEEYPHKRLIRRIPNSYSSSNNISDVHSTISNTAMKSHSHSDTTVDVPSDPDSVSDSGFVSVTDSSSKSVYSGKVAGLITGLVRSRRWFDANVVASVAIGILIAIIAFPMINYAKKRIERHFTWGTIHEINKSVDHYTQIQVGTREETPANQQTYSSIKSQPVNLAESDWQELKPTEFPSLLIDSLGNAVETSALYPAPVDMYPNLLKSVSINSTPGSFHSSSFQNQSPDIILGQANSSDFTLETAPYEIHEFTDRKFIPDVDILIFGGSALQTAYGQNVLFQNGRIFVRILPVFAPNK